MGTLLLLLAVIRRAPFGLPAVAGTLFMVGGMVLALRRIAFPRSLELGQDAILLPTGFLQRRTTRISYADIQWIQEGTIQTSPRLAIGANGRTFEFNPFMLDATGFLAVRDFLNSLPGPKENAVSFQNQPIERGKYCFQCSYEGNGTISASNGEILWHVKTQHSTKRPRYPYGWLLRLPDFVVYDKTDKELIRIKRERRLPLAQFVMIEAGVPVCTIRQRSILLNRYTLDFAGQSKWTFHMPLFTVIFRGKSETGARIQVELHTHNVWYVLIDTNADNPLLVAALAFIHRERLRCV